MTPEQEQYLVDLLNREVYQSGERSDTAQMKCKVGKLCNGRCIPQSHQCNPASEQAPNQPKKQPQKGMTTGQKVALGLLGGYVGLNVAAGIGVAASLNHAGTAAGNDFDYEESSRQRAESFRKSQEDFRQRQEEFRKRYAQASGPGGAGFGGDGFNGSGFGGSGFNGSGFGGGRRSRAGAGFSKPSSSSTPWHETLGVDKNASPAEVKKAYRDLSKKHHPDKGGSKEAFEKLSSAYEESKRKDSLDVWDGIQQAYRAAQQHHSRVSPLFWKA